VVTVWNGWVFAPDRRVTEVRLPWGSILRYEDLRHGPLLRVSDAAYALVILCVAAWVVRYAWRPPAGERARAGRLALGIGVFILGALNDLAVTSELYGFAYLMEYAYLGMILVMSHSLSSGVLEMARTRGELRRSLARLERIFDSVDEVYLETTFEGTILEVSPSVKRG
jgi:PAS domain-containing protein